MIGPSPRPSPDTHVLWIHHEGSDTGIEVPERVGERAVVPVGPTDAGERLCANPSPAGAIVALEPRTLAVDVLEAVRAETTRPLLAVARNSTYARAVVDAGADDYLLALDGRVEPTVLAARFETALATGESVTSVQPGETGEDSDESSLLSVLLDTAPTGVLVTDERGRLAEANEYALDALDLDVEASTGHDPSTWLVLNEDGAPRPEQSDPISLVLETGEAVTDAPVVAQVGETCRWLQLSAAPLDHRGGCVASFVDVTDQRERQRELETQRERLTVLHRVLRHDIRTISNLLLGHASMLEDDGDVGRHAAAIAETVDDMTTLCTKAHQLQQAFESGGSAERIDAATLLRELVADLRTANPSAIVYANVPGSAPVEANGRLSVAFENLLENAVIHADADRPQVDVTCRSDETDDEVVITIADDGPGVPDGEIEVLQRGEETPLEHSSGVGLWLANWIVSASGGGLTIDATDGTTVTVRLPRADPPEGERAGEHPAPARASNES